MKDTKHTIKMELITPVHIGNGNFLYNNIDYIVEKDKIYVIDVQKVFEKIGYDEKLIQTWVTKAEEGYNIMQIFPRGRITNLKDVSQRVIPIKYNNKKENKLKECLHDGMGIAYIPGSSIKGAIRSALMGSLAQKARKDKLNNCEKDVFGADPYCEFMRFIQVGDAYFEKECECATKATSINIRETEGLLATNLGQAIECIDLYTTTFSIKLSKSYNEKAVQEGMKKKENENEKDPTPIKPLPQEVSDIGNLFKTINAHTLRLINEDIDFWENFAESSWEKYMNRFSDDDEKNTNDYIDALYIIKDVIEESTLEGDACVLRIGYASGWKFMTGSWITDEKELKEAEKQVRESKKYGEYSKKYTKYPFPKTRRVEEFVDEDSDEIKLGLLGFVKLKIMK